MKKLKEIIKNCVYFGKFPKGITPFMVDILIEIYNDLLAGRETGFIQKEINDLLGKCGIKTREFGIGWETVIV